MSEALDRLSRDQADIASLYKQLSYLGVRLFTLSEGDITELHVGLKGTMNALFLKDLARKTHRGLEGRVREGRSGGGLSFGYSVVAGDLGAGHIVPSEAETVRRIFRDFVAGKSPRNIARQLNNEGVPGPRGAVGATPPYADISCAIPASSTTSSTSGSSSGIGCPTQRNRLRADVAPGGIRRRTGSLSKFPNSVSSMMNCGTRQSFDSEPSVRRRAS